ncbi:MAG: hypothetical protein IKZ08_05285 [Bacteroidales bacterium]|nr:hypothetical protein [Bacteroidales bacterium]MBR5862725.1 hypothetical protein [Bacteroidales bacterium]
MRKYILLLCTLCLGLVSCVKENMTGVDADGLTTFKAVHADAQTKTVLEGLTPMWTPADKISVYDGKNNEFANSLSAPALTAEFKGKLKGQGAGRESFMAASPYSDAYSFSFLGSIVSGLEVPAEQTAVEGSYDPKAAPAVAYSTSTNLSFNNAYSLVKFTIVSDGVTEVSFEGNAGEILAGKMNVTKESPLKISVTKGEAKVVLKGEFKKGSTYYLSTVPVVLTGGFKAVLKTSAGETVESMVFTNPVGLERSGMVNLGNLSLDPNESELPSVPGVAEEGYLYFKPTADWTANGAHIAAFFWKDETDNTWVDLVEDAEEGVYKCETPEGYSNIIFVSIKAGAVNHWDNKLVQTTDLTVPAGEKVCFVPTGKDGEGKVTGEWTAYPPTDVPADPNPGNPGGDVETVETIYLRPNSNWLEAGARFAAYFFEGANNTWVSLTADAEANVFKCDVPDGYSNVIFVRMNPGVSDNRWNTDADVDPNKPVWNQTPDLFVPSAGSSSICYVVTPGTWGEDGYWTTYPPVVTEPDPTPDPGTGENPNPGTGGEEITACKLTLKVNKAITWYDKYIYSWDANGEILGTWPGVKLGWVGEEGDYYVYYHDFDKSLNGKKINYIISGDGAQTKDLTVTLNGANTTVTVEQSDLN